MSDLSDEKVIRQLRLFHRRFHRSTRARRNRVDALRDSGEASSEHRELVRQLYSLETALLQVNRLEFWVHAGRAYRTSSSSIAMSTDYWYVLEEDFVNISRVYGQVARAREWRMGGWGFVGRFVGGRMWWGLRLIWWGIRRACNCCWRRCRCKCFVLCGSCAESLTVAW